MNATLLVESACALGEGVQWNAAVQRVYWTDIFGDVLLSCSETGTDFRRLDLPGGLCAFAFTDQGNMLAAFKDGLYWFDPVSGARDLITTYQPDRPETRMNDGNLDRQGRFLVGGIDEDGMRPITPVWRVGGADAGQAEVLQGVGCANSICFSPDGTTMYFADTAGHDIYRFDYDISTGIPSNKQHFATMAPGFGKPDGSTVDAEGGLWNARFGGGCVQRFALDGTDSTRVTLPVPNVTCCCIGGAEMNKLFITTARLGMEEEALRIRPEAGGLFVATLDVKGLPHGVYQTRELAT